jgi:hypothetical protein
MLAGQHGLEPFLDKLLARPGEAGQGSSGEAVGIARRGDGCQAGIERRSDLAVTQCFTALRGIRFQ